MDVDSQRISGPVKCAKRPLRHVNLTRNVASLSLSLFLSFFLSFSSLFFSSDARLSSLVRITFESSAFAWAHKRWPKICCASSTAIGHIFFCPSPNLLGICGASTLWRLPIIGGEFDPIVHNFTKIFLIKFFAVTDSPLLSNCNHQINIS